MPELATSTVFPDETSTAQPPSPSSKPSHTSAPGKRVSQSVSRGRGPLSNIGSASSTIGASSGGPSNGIDPSSIIGASRSGASASGASVVPESEGLPCESGLKWTRPQAGAAAPTSASAASTRDGRPVRRQKVIAAEDIPDPGARTIRRALARS